MANGTVGVTMVALFPNAPPSPQIVRAVLQSNNTLVDSNTSTTINLVPNSVSVKGKYWCANLAFTVWTYIFRSTVYTYE